jgi:hypothetical protein
MQPSKLVGTYDIISHRSFTIDSLRRKILTLRLRVTIVLQFALFTLLVVQRTCQLETKHRFQVIVSELLLPCRLTVKNISLIFDF